MKVDRNPVLRLGRESPGFSQCIRRARVAAVAGFTLAAGLFAQGNVNAQIVSPPPLPPDVIVFPMRDFVSISGYAPFSDLLIQVRRGNSTVGLAKATTDSTGFVEVNHPGGVCWQDVTPDVTANDVVQVTYDDTTNNRQLLLPVGTGYATRTSNAVTQPAVIVGNTVVVKGKALQGITAIPITRLEIRIIQPAFRDTPGSRIRKRDIRADSLGGVVEGNNPRDFGARGFLTYDPPTAACRVGCFTAVFTGLNETERMLATGFGAETRVMAWQVTDAAANRLGMTIYEADVPGGPGMGGCPPGPGGPVGPNPPAYPVAYDPLNLTDAAIPPTDPTPLHAGIGVFPSRDFVSADGYPIGTDLQIVVRRQDPLNPNAPNGVIVGTARGLTVGFPGGTGMLEANHPGGVCWSGQTPDIRSGDKVDIFEVANGAFLRGETQQVIGATVSGPPAYNAVTGQLVINGTMPTNWDLTRLEQRIVQPAFLDTVGSRITKRDIRADTAGGRVDGVPGGTGFLEQTSATTWRATYTGLNDIERALVMSGESRIMAWHNADAAGNRFGLTIFEYNVSGGPGMGGRPEVGAFTIPIPLP